MDGSIHQLAQPLQPPKWEKGPSMPMIEFLKLFRGLLERHQINSDTLWG